MGQGLTRGDLMMRCVECPADLLESIPVNRRFTSFEEFWVFMSPASGGSASRPGRRDAA